jgi:hypothetical protein
MTGQIHQSSHSRRLLTHMKNQNITTTEENEGKKHQNEYIATLFNFVSKSPLITIENLHDRRL